MNPSLNIELIDQCRDGDWKAQVEVYRLCFKPLFNTSLRLVNDRTEAEDIVQDAFMQAFRKLHTFNGEMDFLSWVKKIAINRALDMLRKRRADFVPLDAAPPVEEEPDPLPEWEAQEEMVFRIRNAIKLLPDGYRVVLSLHLLEGYDHDEIAGILQISTSTSRSQYSRARQALLQILNPQNN
jgi:RNA polymerase sigma factor (sigma-70 family)